MGPKVPSAKKESRARAAHGIVGSMHAQLPSSATGIAHYPPRGVIANPAGKAALGAGVGATLGHVISAAVTVGLVVKPIVDAGLTISDATQEEATEVARQQQQHMSDAVAAWNRKRHALGFFLTTMGSIAGAYIGADDHQRRSAAVGAGIGTGGIQALSLAFNPVFGAPGILTGALGAYIGARRADRGA